MTLLFKLFFSILLLGVYSTECLAKSKAIPPEDVNVTTPVYYPQSDKVNYDLGVYNYTVSWQGIPAAEALVSIEQNGMYYKILAKAKTYSGIDIFYKLRYQVLGKLNALNLMPVSTRIEHRENSKFKTTKIEYLDSGDIQTTFESVGKNTQSTRFDPKNFTLDPISSAFLARSVNWNIGKEISLDTYNGKSRYLINLECVDKKSMKVNGQDREVWVITPKVKKLTEPSAKQKLREAFIYMTADDKREVLLIESEVFIGTVKTQLDSFTPYTRQGSQTMANIIKFNLSS